MGIDKISFIVYDKNEKRSRLIRLLFFYAPICYDKLFDPQAGWNEKNGGAEGDRRLARVPEPALGRPPAALTSLAIRSGLFIHRMRAAPFDPQAGWNEKNGGAEGDRTPDLLNAIQVCSQLHHCPTIGYYYTVKIPERQSR